MALEISDRPETAAQIAWSPWESKIDSWPAATGWVDEVSDLIPGKTIAWRGLSDADWSLHSLLHRRVKELTGAQPEENELQRYEREILRCCRGDWRYDNLSTLEIFAHLQHYGGPTRLMDVSMNPLVALWFAVEEKFGSEGEPRATTDARLFAFTVKKRITLSHEDAIDWGGRDLPWGKQTPSNGWGSVDSPPVLWIPPAYNERISAQNAGFLIGGTPATKRGGNRWSRGPGVKPKAYLTIKEVRSASSLYVRPAVATRQAQADSYPVYNARITAEAKEEIRETLEVRYGLRSPTIYPDLFGMASEVLKRRLP